MVILLSFLIEIVFFIILWLNRMKFFGCCCCFTLWLLSCCSCSHHHQVWRLNEKKWNFLNWKFTCGNNWLGWSSIVDNELGVLKPVAGMYPKLAAESLPNHRHHLWRLEHLERMTDIAFGICLMRLAHRSWSIAMMVLAYIGNSSRNPSCPIDCPMVLMVLVPIQIL